MSEKEIKFNFEDLKVYQKALEYVDLLYLLSKRFPVEERYALTSQLKRAGHSIALNIAEGSTGSKLQFIRYLDISRGSLYECIVCLTIAKRLKYITSDEENNIRHISEEISKMICGLIASLRK